MVAKRIKEYLISRGIKQTWIVTELQARGVKISKSKLSAILSGSRPLWADMLAEICLVLDIDANIFTNERTTSKSA